MNRGIFKMLNRAFNINSQPRNLQKITISNLTKTNFMEISTMISKTIAVPNAFMLLNLRELLLKNKSDQLGSASQCTHIGSYLAEMLGIFGNTSSCRVSILGQTILPIILYLGSQTGVKTMLRTNTVRMIPRIPQADQ